MGSDSIQVSRRTLVRALNSSHGCSLTLVAAGKPHGCCAWAASAPDSSAGPHLQREPRWRLRPRPGAFPAEATGRHLAGKSRTGPEMIILPARSLAGFRINCPRPSLANDTGSFRNRPAPSFFINRGTMMRLRSAPSAVMTGRPPQSRTRRVRRLFHSATAFTAPFIKPSALNAMAWVLTAKPKRRMMQHKTRIWILHRNLLVSLARVLRRRTWRTVAEDPDLVGIGTHDVRHRFGGEFGLVPPRRVFGNSEQIVNAMKCFPVGGVVEGVVVVHGPDGHGRNCPACDKPRRSAPSASGRGPARGWRKSGRLPNRSW